MSIKEIVFEYVHDTNGCIDYEELTACVFSFKPNSAWNIAHWNYYRSQITLPHGRYFNYFSQIERTNLINRISRVGELKSGKNEKEPKSKNLHLNNMSKKIVRPASMIKQGGLILFATSLKVADLIIPNFYTIERLDPEYAKEKGHQRLLNKGRAKKLADYIIVGQETKDAFFPTSIFLPKPLPAIVIQN